VGRVVAIGRPARCGGVGWWSPPGGPDRLRDAAGLAGGRHRTCPSAAAPRARR